MSRLLADQHVSLGYGDATVVTTLSLTIPDGEITTIIGPNGCGKSTLLRALARLMRPAGGSVILDGQVIHHLPTRDVAKRLGLLSPAGRRRPPASRSTISSARGRYPHQSFLQPPSERDREIGRPTRWT